MSDEQRTPHLSDADLLAYLDGKLDEKLARHIKRSTAYRQRLEDLARQERRLRVSLYRGACPDALELGKYQLKLVAPERAAHIAQHINICPHCVLELQDLRSYLGELAPELEFTFLERVRVLIGRLVPELPDLGGGFTPAPALAGVRGEAGGPLLYEAGEVQVSLEIQDDAARAGHKSVLGLITGVDAAGWQATLWQDSERVEALVVDDLGNFIFESLPPGAYRLILRGSGVEIVIQDLTVN